MSVEDAIAASVKVKSAIVSNSKLLCSRLYCYYEIDRFSWKPAKKPGSKSNRRQFR